MGGCSLRTEVIDDSAMMSLPIPECVITDPSTIPLLGALGGPRAGDVMIVSDAAFTLYSGSKPPQLNYRFQPGEAGLAVAMKFRIRPQSAPPASEEGDQITLNSTNAYFHRLK